MKKSFIITATTFLLFIFSNCDFNSQLKKTTGNITGHITIDSEDIELYGFDVSIPGTSYTAVTDKNGVFTIFDVPAGKNDSLIIKKADFIYYWEVNFEITTGSTTDVGTIEFTSEDFNKDDEKSEPETKEDSENETVKNPVLIWKGKLEEAPENPELCWVYYNTTEKTTYIYDGTNWIIIANLIDDFDINTFDFAPLAPKKPVFSVASGSVDYNDEIELSCITENAKIYYSIDNCISFKEYTTPIKITDNTRITAYSKVFFESDITEAEYSIKTYEIIYHTGNGITTPQKSANLKKGEKIILPDVSKTGYDYKWYKDSGYTNEILNNLFTVEESTELYSKHFPKKYKIHYEFEEAYWELPENYPEYHTYGTDTVLPQLIETTSLTEDWLRGWYIDKNEQYNEVNVLGKFDFTDEIYVKYITYESESLCYDNTYVPWVDNNILHTCENGQVIETVCRYGGMSGADYCNEPTSCGSDYMPWTNEFGELVECVDGFITIRDSN